MIANLMDRMRGGRILILPLVATLALLIAGCGGAVSAGAPAATATPSPTPTPKVLYQADWTNDASQWKLAPGWRVTPDGLATDGAHSTSVYIPYTPAASNYTVEMVATVSDIRPSQCGDEFGMQGKTAAGDTVYFAGIVCIDNQLHGWSEIYSATDTKQFSTQDYTTSRGPRTYTVNVDGPYVTYILNGGELGTVKCNRPTAPNRLLLLNIGVKMVIQRITITTP